MVQYEIKEEDSQSTLIVNGELSIAGAAEFKDVLMKLYETSRNILLDLADVNSIDTSCMQLICAAHKSSIDSSSSIEVKDNLSDSFKQSVTEAGYIRNDKCSAGCTGSCLWVTDK